MNDVLINEWSVQVRQGETHLPPNQSGRLGGRVYGHPDFPDGSFVTTSRVMSAEGRQVTTESGTVYRLGEPSKDYLRWLKDNNLSYDPEHPVVVTYAE